MRKVLSTFIIILLFFCNVELSNAQNVNFYQQKQNELEITRLNQEVAQLKADKLSLAENIRVLEQSTQKLEKMLTASNKRVEDLLDLWVNFENVTLPNLSLSDKELATRINETNKVIEDRDPDWNWGELQRDCPSIGKHQQVKTVISEDKSAAMTYLCFDGKVLHLKTTSNLPI